MGRAMLIICAGVLISLGIVTISTSNQGRMLTQNTVNYAEYTMAKKRRSYRHSDGNAAD
jgi:hypothetical protein